MNVLLAEDDRMLRSIMTDFLEDLDCTVHAVANGAEAVHAVQAKAFDAVFMDCEMPVMDGVTATRTIIEKSSAAGSKCLPVIALTGHTDPSDHARCLEAGMVAILTKPVDMQELEATLTRFVTAKRV